MTDVYARYDYAWWTPGWTVQNPTYSNPGAPQPYPEDVPLVRLFMPAPTDVTTARGAEGVIRVRYPVPLFHEDSGRTFYPGEIRLRFRAGDGFEMLLMATDYEGLTPNDWKYSARLTVMGYEIDFEFELPQAEDEVNVWSLLPEVGE